MTSEEKRDELTFHCFGKSCVDCPLNDTDCEWYSWSDEKVDKMYERIAPPVSEPTEPTEHDPVNHPSHYTNGGMECIDEMVLIFGETTVANFCLCNVWKYRKRALYKNGEEDLKKADWYMAKYKELIEHGRN